MCTAASRSDVITRAWAWEISEISYLAWRRSWVQAAVYVIPRETFAGRKLSQLRWKKDYRMVAQECTPTSHPQRDRICSAFYPHYVRTTPVVFPHCFRCISAVFPLCFPVSPHCCRSPSAVFGCVNLSEKTVAETLSNQRLMYSAMVLLFNTLSVCS